MILYLLPQVVFPAKPQLQRQWPDDSGQRERVPGICQTAMRADEGDIIHDLWNRLVETLAAAEALQVS